MSATVQNAIEAVEQADSNTEAKTKGKATKPAAKKSTAKPKYDAALKATAKRAETLRGRARTIGPVQVLRVKDALGKEDPATILGMPLPRAKAFASGDKSVKQPDSLKGFSAKLADPFCRGRGAAAILLALAGK